jgi:O-antigen/teichoic acid export membrane protein
MPTMAGQAISFLSMPLFASRYGPAEFGHAATCLSLGTIFAGAVTLRLDAQLFLSKSADDAAVKAYQIAIYSTVLCLVGVVGLFLYEHLIGLNPTYYRIGLIAAVSTWAMALNNVGTALLAYRRAFAMVGAMRFLQSTSVVVILAACMLLDVSFPYIVATASALGLMASSGLVFSALRGVHPAAVGRDFFGLIRTNRKYMLTAVPFSVVNASGFLNLFIILVGWLYGPEASGILFLGYRLGGFPTSLLSTSLGNLFSAELAAKPRFNPYLVLGGLLALSLAIYVPIMIAFPWAVAKVANAEWLPVSEIIRPILLLCIAQLSVGPLGPLFLIRGGSGFLLAWELARNPVSALLTLLAFHAGLSFVEATWIYSSGQFLFYLVLAVAIARTFRRAGSPPPVEASSASVQAA